MEDHRTRQTLDALADLFLTEAARPATAAAGTDSRPAAERPREASAGDPLGGPASIRLEPKIAPKVAASPRAASVPPSSEPPLRLHREEEDRGAHAAGSEASRPLPPIAPAAHVEAVILGHLPGLAGPWLTQYAQCRAGQNDAVAILHVAPDRIDMELVEAPAPHASALPTPRSRRVAPDQQDADPVIALDQAARDARRPVRRILVHLDPLGDDNDLARAVELDRWTLATGTDPVAVQAVIQTVRRLADAAPETREKRIGLMVMGSDNRSAETAAAQVRAALSGDLDHPVELIGCQQQMAPVSLRQMGSFENANLHWPRLLGYLVRLPEPEADVDARSAAPQAPEHSAHSAPPEPEPQQRQAEPEPATIAEAVSEPAAEPAPAPKRETTVPPTPRPTASPAPAAVATSEPDLPALLVQHVAELAGAITLEARSPQHPDMPMLLDQEGRLHLAGRATVGSVEAVRSAVMELIEGRRWVAEHRDLIQLTQRQVRFASPQPPMMHLLLDRADLATKLAMRLGEQPGFDLRLHLLQPIVVGEAHHWFCTPLT